MIEERLGERGEARVRDVTYIYHITAGNVSYNPAR
jgi:hypothetical protein